MERLNLVLSFYGLSKQPFHIVKRYQERKAKIDTPNVT